MLHLILSSPFQHAALEQALAYLQPEDELILAQDGVIAAVAPDWCKRLVGRTVYVMAEDLQARGLHPQIGVVIDINGLVALISEKGSPQTWAD
ncbi:sulfurtransferase complex subunit TusB [Aeromonas cavernicola]|uniref:Sulfurtransferase complex subunit TusB n=1 Tax=Aeromonas cavernicola TaxID=1006623 RepID=A0A2H9U8W1_9GAMM|nr:sulfurtransferase complex subunit TusB [Aeromonas cavernicola]PJG60438.1 sulfurtransferase complex subunit TusB [Aeromonas cavernicola]